MRDLLFLSYYTPPRAGIATTRTRQLLRYLPEHGWKVTVVTATLPGAANDIVQTGYVDLLAEIKRMTGFGSKSAHASLGVAPAAKGKRPSLRQRALSFGYGLFTYPDPEAGWFPFARRAIGELLESQRFDAILSSSPPFVSNLVLASLAPKIPWVADFRDLWSESGYYSNPVRDAIDSALERWTLARTSAATTISEPLARVLRSHRPGLSVETIPNAYDAEEWHDVPFETESRTTFVHAGQLFEGRRDPHPLFRSIRALIDEGAITPDEVRVILYASPEAWLTRAIAETRLEEVVRVTGVVARAEVMKAERRADRLLVLLWEGANTEGILTGKLFEYLGARRPILVVGGPPRSAVDEVLDITSAGERVRSEAALKNAVRLAVEEHRAGSVRTVDTSRLVAYEASTMAARFADVLNRVVDAQQVVRPSL